MKFDSRIDLYRAFRSRGYRAASAWNHAGILAECQPLFWDDRIRIRFEPEFDIDISWADDQGPKYRALVEQTIEDQGCWIAICEVRTGCDQCGRSEWTLVDSLGQCIGWPEVATTARAIRAENGHSALDVGYLVDMLSAALESVKAESAFCR